MKQQLRAILKERDMTAAAFARKSGLPRQTVSDWLSGSPPRDIRQVKKAADALNVSVDFLCFGIESPTTSEKITDLDTLVGTDRWLSGIFELRIRRIKK